MASHDHDRCEKDLQMHIISELKKKIPGLDEEFQVIKMSVYTATKVQQKFKVMSDDLNSLIDGIQSLLPLCIERKTSYFYWLISGLLTNLLYQVQCESIVAKRSRKEELLQVRKEVEETELKRLKEDTFIRETEEAISKHVDRISKLFMSYLQSDEAFCTWTEKDLPKIDDIQRIDTDKLMVIYNKCIKQRLESFLQKFENKEKLFATAHADLEERFRQDICNIEKKSRDIDRVLVGESMDQFMPFDVSLDKLRLFLSPRVKNFLVFTSAIFMPILFPIGLAAGILSAPVGAVLAVGNHLRDNQLKNDACLVLTELSKLQAFIENEVVNRVLQEFTEERDRISSISRCHRELITKYKQKCEDLTRSEIQIMANQTVETLDALCKKVRDMNEELMFDAIEHGIQVMMYPPCQIDKRRLQCTETPKDIIGSGSYSTVYKGQFRPLGHGRKNVAVKKLSKTQHPSNVALFLQESAMLRQVEHKSIVRFYGVTMDVQNHEVISLALVFELCSGSLKRHIFKNENCIPWKSASTRAVADFCQWSKEILDALECIHSKGIAHRNLKLDNVLISSGHDHTIKLADLRLTTLENSVTRTICDTRLYMAPEVREGKVYDSSADMYSFGVMIWEMWFGKRAPDKLSNGVSEDEVTRQIQLEMKTNSGKGPFNAPPPKWITLMVCCCKRDPGFRPTATKSKAGIENIEHFYMKYNTDF